MKERSLTNRFFVCAAAMAFLCMGAIAPLYAETKAVSIIGPKYDSEHVAGEAVQFTCRVQNSDDGEIPDEALVWISNLDGNIGTGATLSTNRLSVGLHRVTLEVSNKKGILGTDTIKIKVMQTKASGKEVPIGIGTGGGQYVVNPLN